MDYTKNLSNADEFFNDKKTFDASMMNFAVIGEMTDKLSDEFKENNSHIEWGKIKAFRNIVAHDYLGIDAEEVWQIIKEKLPKLKIQLQSITE